MHDLTKMMALAPSARRNVLDGIDAFYARVEIIDGANVLNRLLGGLDIKALSNKWTASRRV